MVAVWNSWRLKHPETCSPDCVFTEVGAEVECDDNGTPDDPSDDVFTVTLSVYADNPPSLFWEALINGQAVLVADYNRTISIQQDFPISGGGFTVVIQDTENPDLCNTEIEVTPPETCSDACDVTLEFTQEPECDDNGTPFDESDDTYTFTLIIDGTNTGNSGWTTNIGISGDYGDEVTFGPYPISGGGFFLSVADVEIGLCTETIQIIPPDPCGEEECVIQATATSECDDNGTPNDSSDDVFFVDLLVTGFNTGGGWTTTGGSGDYGVETTIGPFPVSGGNITLVITDEDDPNCTTTVTALAPMTCSEQCVITAMVTGSPMCHDANTPSDPSDDFFTFEVTVTEINNANGTWVASNGATGSYGVPTVLGPFPADGSLTTVVFTDIGDMNCFTSVNVSSEPCSGECTISANIQFMSCDDNGTPGDPSDDVFFVGVQVTTPYIPNTSGFWTTDDPTMAGNNFAYGSLVAFGPYFVASGPVVINVFDVGNPSCNASVTALPPPPCPSCEIEATVIEPVCDDNGTPSDPSDDVFFFTVTVTGQNASPLGWKEVLPNGSTGLTGMYNVPTTFGPYPIAAGPVEILIRDRGDSACETEFTVDPPEACPQPECILDAQVSNIECDDNGTPEGEGDDTFTFELLVEDLGGGGTTWTATVAGQTINGTYGVSQLVGPFDISDGDVVVVITDANNPDCNTITVPVHAPHPCSDPEPCELTAMVEDVICDNQGTPEDGSDDTFTFVLTVTGDNVGTNWVTSDGTVMGEFGVPVTFGPYAIADGDVILTINGVQNDDCTVVVYVTAPEPCVEVVCEIDVDINNILCDDNGTPFDSSDDTFSFDATVTGNNTSIGWFTIDVKWRTGDWLLWLYSEPFWLSNRRRRCSCDLHRLCRFGLQYNHQCTGSTGLL